MHKLFQQVVMFVCSMEIVLFALTGDYESIVIMISCCIISFSLMKYFIKYPSYKCMCSINICNILLALYRFYPAL